MRLRIESVNGSPVNDYRIRNGHVELRLLDSSGHEYPPPGSRWRMLDVNDIQMHHALQTLVSAWLRKRVGTEDYAEMKRAA